MIHINIATALNKKYVPYASVMLYSLGVNNEENIVVYLLHSELDAEDFEVINRCVSSQNITIVPMKINIELFGNNLYYTEQWSIEAYYRLLLLDLLPKEVERLLYLDVDVIVNKSLKEFYEKEFESYDILACADMCGVSWERTMDDKQKEMFKSRLTQGYQYFNSGVMLMNIENMRSKYNFNYYMDLIKNDWNYEMSAPDQDILNYVHWESVGYVDWAVYDLFARLAHEFGISYEEVKEQVAIIHFAGSKPWESGDYHYDIEKLWWDYAKQTCLYSELLQLFMENSMADKLVEQRIENVKIQNKRLLEINKLLLREK